MNFSLTDDQRAIQETARVFAAAELAPHSAPLGRGRDLRDLRVHQSLEGTNEIMRVIIARELHRP